MLNINLIVVSAYRTPNGDLDLFMVTMNDVLDFLSAMGIEIVIASDLDLDIRLHTSHVKDFMNMLRPMMSSA